MRSLQKRQVKIVEFHDNKIVITMIILIVFVSLFNLSKESMFLPKKIFLDSVYKDAPKSWFEYVRKFIHKILGDNLITPDVQGTGTGSNRVQPQVYTLMSIFGLYILQ